jgi:hypothetical protein
VAPARRGPALRAALVAAGVAAMLLVGFLVGANAADRPHPPAATSPPSTAPPTTVADGPSPAAQACLDAMDDASAAISYLVGRIDDARLTKAVRLYHEHRRICLGAPG